MESLYLFDLMLKRIASSANQIAGKCNAVRTSREWTNQKQVGVNAPKVT
jgi:hypothetical protein